MKSGESKKVSSKFDAKLDAIDKKLVSHDKTFEKFFLHMDKHFDDMKNNYEKQDKKIDNIAAAIAELGGQLKDYHQEMLMSS